MIINEHVGSPIRSDNVYFANNEQASLVFFIAHAEHNLIKLKLCNNQAAQDVNNVSESTIWNWSKPIKFPHLWKLANQSTLNKAHVIEIKKACKVAFMQARESVVVRYREELVNWKKRQDGGNLFFKASS